MKPRSKSEWIAPAACGALAPASTVQARASFGPTVKKVSRLSSLYPARITRASPLSSSPSSLRNSARSSVGIVAISASIAAETTTACAPSAAALSNTRAE